MTATLPSTRRSIRRLDRLAVVLVGGLARVRLGIVEARLAEFRARGLPLRHAGRTDRIRLARALTRRIAGSVSVEGRTARSR